MEGANEFCKVFKKAEQIGQLYILPSSHARGPTFRIYVIPNGEDVIENGGINPPLNTNSIEVYGAISGQLGWTETYGWKHSGKWVADFNKIFNKRKEEIEANEIQAQTTQKSKEYEIENRIESILNDYV